MRINSYTAMNKQEVIDRIDTLKHTIELLTNLANKDYKTLQEAFSSVINKQLTKREFSKLEKLLGDNIVICKELRSWEWFAKYGGTKEIRIYKTAVPFKRYKLMDISLDENNLIDRHCTTSSLYIKEHTIEELLLTSKTSLEKHEQALASYNSIADKIKSYEEELKAQAKASYEKHLKDIGVILYSNS